MPVPPSRKQSIAIVGAGNLAAALAVSLLAAGYQVEVIISRGAASSVQRARRLALEVGASTVTLDQAQIGAEIVWFCVPDAAIASAARSLLKSADWKGKVALHSSGALTSDELYVLQDKGSAVASAHPLMTFVRGSRPQLTGVPFAIEGDQKAVRSVRAIVRSLRGRAWLIRKEHKQAYHAWGMFVSPLLTALLAASENVAAAAGVSKKAARQKMLPILHQTLANYARLGAAASFSGPIARGDVDTVRKHLKILRTVPQAGEVYLALARLALRELPAKNRVQLEKILKLKTKMNKPTY
ncbi:MAG TPA: DUF2520 domain-containing protein [Candidatus Sulfotelmatobacter sp.]|nr:DUF2520 domain-containing protein [Candidatus Sulfotelmatobacter sp.]